MSITSLSSSFGSASGTPRKRTRGDLVSADFFNRLYVTAMFAVIAIIGGFGLFALARSQQGAAIVAHSFENANDATQMRTALDREQTELHWQMRKEHGRRSERLDAAATAYAAASADAQLDGLAGREILQTLGLIHAAFEADSRAIFAAIARGDKAKAERIDANSARPNVLMIRHDLDDLSADLFAASVAAEAQNKRFSRYLQLSIGSATGVGILQMAGFAILLGRYKRSAVV